MEDKNIQLANNIYESATKEVTEKLNNMTKELDCVKDEARASGILQMIDYNTAHNEMIKYVVLYNLKHSKEYKKGGMSWEKFCELEVNEPRRSVDRKLAEIKPVLDNLSERTVGLLGLSFSKIRFLGQTITANQAIVEDDAIVVNGQKIPLTPDYKEEISALLDSLKEEQQKQLDEKDAEIKTAKQKIESKERQIGMQDKRLNELEKELKKYKTSKGLSALEKEFINELETTLETFQGIVSKVDPERIILPPKLTPGMKSSYLGAVKQIYEYSKAIYDTVSDQYGEPENTWEMPKQQMTDTIIDV